MEGWSYMDHFAAAMQIHMQAFYGAQQGVLPLHAAMRFEQMMALGAMYDYSNGTMPCSSNESLPPGYVRVGPNELLYVGTAAESAGGASKQPRRNPACPSSPPPEQDLMHLEESESRTGSKTERTVSMDSVLQMHSFPGGSPCAGEVQSGVTSKMIPTPNFVPTPVFSRGLPRGTPEELAGQLREWVVEFGGFSGSHVEHIMSSSDDELGIAVPGGKRSREWE